MLNMSSALWPITEQIPPFIPPIRGTEDLSLALRQPITCSGDGGKRVASASTLIWTSYCASAFMASTPDVLRNKWAFKLLQVAGNETLTSLPRMVKEARKVTTTSSLPPYESILAALNGRSTCFCSDQ
ncbi:hypothetical protein E2C01_010146 [Portunus trituberculatus]|uniref:Uncharacterized protein n=1 Tax=Portunus trituberculatus TaxID=210409 RepID=A0A5B7D7P2_PORTR|nr:hypothetical protein [Portunus trituberculatus]